MSDTSPLACSRVDQDVIVALELGVFASLEPALVSLLLWNYQPVMSLMSGNVYSPLPTNYPQPDSARNLKQAESSKNWPEVDMNWVIPPRRPMLVANDEHIRNMSSWLSRLDGFPCAASVKEMYHGICIVVSIFWDMPPRHFVHFLFVSISYVLPGVQLIYANII